MLRVSASIVKAIQYCATDLHKDQPAYFITTSCFPLSVAVSSQLHLCQEQSRIKPLETTEHRPAKAKPTSQIIGNGNDAIIPLSFQMNELLGSKTFPESIYQTLRITSQKRSMDRAVPWFFSTARVLPRIQYTCRAVHRWF